MSQPGGVDQQHQSQVFEAENQTEQRRWVHYEHLHYAQEGEVLIEMQCLLVLVVSAPFFSTSTGIYYYWYLYYRSRANRAWQLV
jgi:hypothetical protein